MKTEKSKNADKKDGFKSRRAQRMDAADWGGVDAKVLQWTIAVVASKGGALRIGYTSDGGAYAVGIYGDGEPYTEYIRPGDDVEGFLRDLAGYFEDQR